MTNEGRDASSESPFVELLLLTAGQLWLGGMAALERVQREGVRAISSVGARAGKSSDPSEHADAWQRLENVLEEGVVQAASHFGRPSGADLDRLADRLDALSAGLREVSKQAALRAHSGTSEPPEDDLTLISGVGSVTQSILREKGYASFQQIANLDDSDIDRIADGVPGLASRFRRGDWVGQARRLHREKYGSGGQSNG